MELIFEVGKVYKALKRTRHFEPNRKVTIVELGDIITCVDIKHYVEPKCATYYFVYEEKSFSIFTNNQSWFNLNFIEVKCDQES